MKTIEDLNLNNMVLIEKYLNNKLNEKEEKAFLKQLSNDEELQEDYEVAKDILLNQETPKPKAKLHEALQRRLKQYDKSGIRLSRKGVIGKELISNGIVAVLAVIFMILTCALVILLIN